jgi:hypothetical protein
LEQGESGGSYYELLNLRNKVLVRFNDFGYSYFDVPGEDIKSMITCIGNNSKNRSIHLWQAPAGKNHYQ